MNQNNPHLEENREGLQKSKLANLNQLKKVQENVGQTKNRVALLRRQLNKEKQAIKKNKQKIQQTLDKKVVLSKIGNYKQRDYDLIQGDIDEKKRRNQAMKYEHEKSIEEIQKAIYLVKLDDAREIKNISQNHKKKLKEMEENTMMQRNLKKKEVRQQWERSKERQKQYFKDKLVSVYTEQAIKAQRTNQNKNTKLNQLKKLQQEEIQLLQELSQHQNKHAESKKQYIAALSLPIKQVAEAMGQSQSQLDLQKSNQSILRKSQIHHKSAQLRPKDLKLPHANINPAKLQVILRELKKMDKKDNSQMISQVSDL